MSETLGIAGAGTIACGLAAAAAATGDEVLLWARSDGSASRARAALAKTCSKLGDGGIDPARIEVVTDIDALQRASYVVEAVVEDHGSKSAVLSELAARVDDRAVLATTTSSLSIAELAHVTGRPERFAGLHVFNPVPRMKLVE